MKGSITINLTAGSNKTVVPVTSPVFKLGRPSRACWFVFTVALVGTCSLCRMIRKSLNGLFVRDPTPPYNGHFDLELDTVTQPISTMDICKLFGFVMLCQQCPKRKPMQH